MRTTQNGAILIVSLLMLLVMTIIGVAGMSSTVLEEKMANNNRQKHLAIQSASGALRDAELWIITNVTTVTEFEAQFSGAPNELYWSRRPTPASSLRPSTIANVLDRYSWAVGNSAIPPSTLVNGTEDPPRYIIEYVGRFAGDLSQDKIDPTANNDSREYAFRITAIGWGMDNTTTYVAQSTLRMQLL
ncbi:hypothetical protein MNBD_GAMMA15-750 [hydrothermal vent metagenome]|uniref:Type IV fimbrial biogenesis protein PilX n=1 Tax=hydrothermal vent metagenome TaxID=652676 RepID=A0A3B0YVT6_9ZZZZ